MLSFKILYFLISKMDLLYIWYFNGYLSSILFSTVVDLGGHTKLLTIHTPAHVLGVKVTDLRMLCLSFCHNVFKIF